MHFPEGWANEKNKVLLLKNSFFTTLLVALKKVAGPVLEKAKELAVRRIADFATLRKAPMVRGNSQLNVTLALYQLLIKAYSR